MRMLRGKEDEEAELAQEDTDKETDLLTQARDEAKHWKKAYEEQYKRAEIATKAALEYQKWNSDTIRANLELRERVNQLEKLLRNTTK